MFGFLRLLGIEEQALVDRQALVPLFARGHPDLEDLRRLLPVQQVWGKGMSR